MMSDGDMLELVAKIKDYHVNAGEVYMMGHLRSQGIQIQRC